MNAGLIIPVVAILGSFAIPIVAIVMDFRRRRLMYEERRAMIERGMELPPLEDSGFDMGKWRRDPVARRERALRAGVSLTFLGVGLGLAAWLNLGVLDESFIPHRAAGFMAMGASIVTFLGIGNLVYYALTAKRAGAPTT